MLSFTGFFTFAPLMSHCMWGLWGVRLPENPLNSREDGLIAVVDSGCPTSWASRTGGGSESRTNPGLEPGPWQDRTLPKSFLNSDQVLEGGDREGLTNDWNPQNAGGLSTPPVVQTYGDQDQILASPLQNMHTNLFRMNPQFRLKNKQTKKNRSDIVWRRTCESWSSVSSVSELGLDDSLPAQQWPSGMLPLPFSALFTN